MDNEASKTRISLAFASTLFRSPVLQRLIPPSNRKAISWSLVALQASVRAEVEPDGFEAQQRVGCFSLYRRGKPYKTSTGPRIPHPALVEHGRVERVDHGRFDVLVAKEVLKCADGMPVLQEMRGEATAERVAGRILGEPHCGSGGRDDPQADDGSRDG